MNLKKKNQIKKADTVEKEEFNKYKEKQLVYLESYKGFLGFRHIVINDKALKPVEELNQSAVRNLRKHDSRVKI